MKITPEKALLFMLRISLTFFAEAQQKPGTTPQELTDKLSNPVEHNTLPRFISIPFYQALLGWVNLQVPYPYAPNSMAGPESSFSHCG